MSMHFHHNCHHIIEWENEGAKKKKKNRKEKKRKENK